jgi:DNA-binding winged helix-turn-helix (wHTH) protein/Tol biopolymer transport system component/tRNA A-37 threonylcarbamoyl transferase component Bud32
MTPQVIRFPPFEVDLQTRELRKDGERISLPDQSFQILWMLLLRPGELITRAEIQKKLWPNDTVVEFENSIHAAVRRLRLALGDPASSPRYIETLARRGYRWVLPAEEIQGEPPAAQSPDQDSRASSGFVHNPEYLIGRKLSHYRVLQVVGGGGMGIVYAAEDLKLGRRVALKFLPPELAGDQKALQRLQREARAASSLNHPNICTIHGLEEDEGQAFIVMELLDGITLRELIASAAEHHKRDKNDEGPLPLARLLDIALQTLDGLEAAHREGLIHRDIKPANIFITTTGRVKILDFGLAKLEPASWSEADPAHAINGDRDLTRTGLRMGTAAYMSPEQVRAETLDTRTDLFSFGLVLYEMAAGRPAFSGDTIAHVHAAILNQVPARLEDLNPRIPARLARVIEKALEKDRNSRVQSAAELRSALTSLKNSVSTGHRWVSRGAVAALVAVLIAGAVYWRMTRPSHVSSVPEFKLRQLTASSAETHISSGAISLRGKYLAFTDVRGVHALVLESGEIINLKLPSSFDRRAAIWECVGWFPDEQTMLVNAHTPTVSPGDWYSPGSSIWIFSLAGRPPRMLRENATANGVSWDGSLISFGTHKDKFGDRELWLMGPSGEDARRLYETDEDSALAGSSWSPDCKRILYGIIRANGLTLVSRDMVGGPPLTVLSPEEMTGVNQLMWLRNGDVIYSKADRGAINTAANLWQMGMDSRTGAAIEKPRQITNWTGFDLGALSATEDSHRIAFLGFARHATVYLADLQPKGSQIGMVSHFTLTESQDYIADWAPDSKSILLVSNRTGHNGLYVQALNGATPRLLIPDTRGMTQFRISPDGKWVVYLGQTDLATKSVRVMRTPLEEFLPQAIFENSPGGMLSCARLKDLCILAEPAGDGAQVVVASFSPLKGRGVELSRFTVSRAANFWAVDLAPDGNSIAELTSPSGPIRVIALDRRQHPAIAPVGLEDIQNIHWSANGDGLYLSSAGTDGTTLWRVDLEGRPHRIWENRGTNWSAGLPSPNGRYIALQTAEESSNLWMLESADSPSSK